MNSVKKIHLRSQNTYRTAGGSGDDSVHVLSVFTPTLRGENVWGYAYNKNRSSLLLLSALWRYDNAFIFTNQSEVDFGITLVSKQRSLYQYIYIYIHIYIDINICILIVVCEFDWKFLFNNKYFNYVILIFITDIIHLLCIFQFNYCGVPIVYQVTIHNRCS